MVTFQFEEPVICNRAIHCWLYSLLTLHSSYLKLCVFVDVLCSLSVQDKLSLIGNPNYVVLHGMAEQPLKLQRKLNAADSVFLYILYIIIK